MALNSAEVRVAGTGHVYVAPSGTALPTDASAALGASWKDLGYVSEDGVAFKFGRETQDLNAWQGDKVRVITLREPKTVEFALMQSNSDVLTAAFGGGAVTSPSTGEYKFTPAAAGSNAERALVIEFVDGGITYRYAFARVQVEGDVSFTLTRGGAVTYPITFGVLASDPAYEILTNDPVFD